MRFYRATAEPTALRVLVKRGPVVAIVLRQSNICAIITLGVYLIPCWAVLRTPPCADMETGILPHQRQRVSDSVPPPARNENNSGDSHFYHRWCGPQPEACGGIAT